MTDWWSNDPIASAPAPSPTAKPAGNWWDADPVLMPGSPASRLSGAAAALPDPVRAEARQDLDRAYAAGLPKPGLARQFVQGATLNSADEVLAALDTPVQMILKGKSIGDAYRYAKTRENMMLEDARQDAPIASAAGQIAGGVLTGGGLFKAGATAIPTATARLGSVGGGAAGGLVDGAALGAGSGFMDGDGLQNRLEETARGAAVGGAVGGALPLAAAALKPVVAPVASNIAARVNPAGYAERQLGRAASRSGQTSDEIADRLGQAVSEGQGEYRLLDALDYPGARLGAVVAKNPGEGRTQLREFLNQRQEGQGHRIGNALADGLDAPETAQAASTRMTRAREAADNEAFGAVRRDAGPVDVQPVVGLIDDTLRPVGAGHLTDPNSVAYDSVEGALARARALLTDGRQSVSDFTIVQRARGDIADAVEVAKRQGRGNQARLLRDVRNALDRQLVEASPSYRAAMDRSSAAAREIDAVETGTAAAGRGRSEDKIAAFSNLTPGEQAAFRTGYADPLIAKAQAGAEGANKARPFTSLAMRTELPAFAQAARRDGLMRQIGRENEMFANRAEALGNSKTAENLADNADTGIDTGIIEKLLGGRFVGAAKDLLTRGAAGVNGNTEAVRDNLARLLMTGSPDEVRVLLTRLAQSSGARSQMGGGLYRGLLSGGLPTLNSLLSERARQPNRRQARIAR